MIDKEAIVEVRTILNRVCDGQAVSLTAGRLRYLLDQLDEMYDAATEADKPIHPHGLQFKP